MDTTTELLVEKLNKLRVKQAMYQSSGLDTPKHIEDNIQLIQKALGRVEPTEPIKK